jgi:uncharacterized protein
MLSLNLARIRTPHEHFTHEYRAGDLPADSAYRVAAPVALDFDIFKDKDQFHVVGTVKTTLELPCSRCLEPFTLPVDASFDLRYQPQSANAGEGEREVHDEDLTTAYYANDEIDLEQLMKEQFQLALPMKPLCSDACRGLCPQCGTNLNRGTCACDRQWHDPRLAALETLKHRN